MYIVDLIDLDNAPITRLPLTMVQRSAIMQGVLAMRLLPKRLTGDDDPPRAITLETSLVGPASSCAPHALPAPTNRRQGARAGTEARR